VVTGGVRVDVKVLRGGVVLARVAAGLDGDQNGLPSRRGSWRRKVVDVSLLQ
jgi:hypothetical protein